MIHKNGWLVVWNPNWLISFRWVNHQPDSMVISIMEDHLMVSGSLFPFDGHAAAASSKSRQVRADEELWFCRSFFLRTVTDNQGTIDCLDSLDIMI